MNSTKFNARAERRWQRRCDRREQYRVLPESFDLPELKVPERREALRDEIVMVPARHGMSHAILACPVWFTLEVLRVIESLGYQ